MYRTPVLQTYDITTKNSISVLVNLQPSFTFLNVEVLVCFNLLQHAGHGGAVHVVDQVDIHYVHAHCLTP
jgi:hypothetical protein